MFLLYQVQLLSLDIFHFYERETSLRRNQTIGVLIGETSPSISYNRREYEIKKRMDILCLGF